MTNKIIIILDSGENHVTAVYTTDPNLEVRLVDIDTHPEMTESVVGPYDPEVTVLVDDVDAAALAHILEEVPDYKPEKEGDYA